MQSLINRSHSQSFCRPHQRHSMLSRRVDFTKVSQFCHATKPQSSASEWEVNYTECSDYLKTIGLVNLAEIQRVLDIAMNPASLNAKTKNSSARILSVKDDIAPLIGYLEQKGIKAGDIKKLVIGHPPVLCYSTDKLEALWSYLEGVLTGIDVATVLVERPTLLGLEQANVERIIEYLKYIETPSESIILYLSRSI